jgi:hypothetical protein
MEMQAMTITREMTAEQREMHKQAAPLIKYCTERFMHEGDTAVAYTLSMLIAGLIVKVSPPGSARKAFQSKALANHAKLVKGLLSAIEAVMRGEKETLQ